MMLLILALVPVAAVRDVIVIGGGGAGAHFAVFAKDAGYKVTVLEIKSQLGGHCSTRPRDPPINNVTHIELGFTYLHNTTRNNERGFYNDMPYTVNMVEHVSRFTEIHPEGPFSFTGGSSYIADVEHGLGADLEPNADPTTFTPLVTTLANYLRITYPELEGGPNPDVIRPILQLPLPDFFQQEPFLKNFAGFFTGPAQSSAFLPFANVSAFHVMKNLPGSFLMQFVEPGWLFTFQRGCQEMYDNITTYLREGEDEENVFLNANVFKVTRPMGDPGNGKVTVHFRDSTGAEKHVIANDLVIAIPPTLDNMQKIGLDLRPDEFEVWQSMEIIPGYIGLKMNAVQNFSLLDNANFQDPLGELNLDVAPVPFVMCEFGNLSACSAFGISLKTSNATEILGLVNTTLELMTLLPNPISLTVTDFDQHLGYFPHQNARVLQDDPGYFGKVNALQGKSKTLWIGAGPTISARTNCIEHANLIRQQFLPDLTSRRSAADSTQAWTKPNYSRTRLTWH